MNRLPLYGQHVSPPASSVSLDYGMLEEALVLDARDGLRPSGMVDRKFQELMRVASIAVSQARRGRYELGIAPRQVPYIEFMAPIKRRFEKECVMRVVQQGDVVQVHYVKVFRDGSVVASHGQVPTELTVGIDHPRLPGLGLALVGMAVGESRILVVPARAAYGPHEPRRIRRLARHRFAGHKNLAVGQWVRVWDRQGRRRLVRIVEIGAEIVIVDANHPRAGQSLELEVELVAIHEQQVTLSAEKDSVGHTPDLARALRENRWRDDGGRW